ncbi:acyl-CoA desaturase [Actinomadura sp. DC4]|uniref:fatty acid desaturase family protein n=1 Tax=Actinomadura sp. DC4 TaxID=3055069 RepID=UPI0025AFB146|nr:acyl-CoA desaturase [Actinomadura sp. DC4]MDN3351472.1 acyl-CoA desaturase [Actinomadura sp. DC4]
MGHDTLRSGETPETASVRRGRPRAARGSDYAELSRQVKQAGLLDRRPAYYAVKITLNLMLFALGWVIFALLGRSWWQLAVAAFLAVTFTQVAFIGHDAGHRQIFASKRANDLLGRLHGGLLVGLSYGWWVDKHNRHHAHPNQEGHDPDIAIGAIAFTESHARARRGLGALLARYQAYLFFPMLLLEGLSLHVASVRALLNRTHTSPRTRLAEAAMLVVHTAGYLTVLFLVLTPVQAVCFLVVQQGLFGVYMGASFAPNHKGMPIFGEDEKIDYLRRQVLTSRNVRGGRFTDFVLGGLNYQIEHHLFPSMPRPSLRRAQALVHAYCKQHGISYAETSLARSYAEVIRHLHAVGVTASRRTPTKPADGMGVA